VDYVVTYVEVAPSSVGEARALLRQLRTASLREEDGVAFEILHRSERSSHFAIIEAWREGAQEAHATADHVKAFREKLQRHLTAGYDERKHVGLAVSPSDGDADGALHVVTHVDVVPAFKDPGVALVRQLVEASRGEAGCLRFDALTQASRANHMTLVETWRDRAAFEAHMVGSHVRRFRDELTPMSGSLFDERLYTAID